MAIILEKSARQVAKDAYDDPSGDLIIMRALALTILDQINTLRALHSLPTATKAQLKAAIIAKIDSGDAD